MIEEIKEINEQLKRVRQYLKNMDNKNECEAIWLRNQDLKPQYKLTIKKLERKKARLEKIKDNPQLIREWRLKQIPKPKKPKIKVKVLLL